MSDIGDDRFTMNTIIVSHKLAAIAAEGQQRLVMYDYHNHHKALLSDELRQRISSVESAVHKKPE